MDIEKNDSEFISSSKNHIIKEDFQDTECNDERENILLKLPSSLQYGFIGGLGAGLLGATIWAAITVVTKYQIGYMAIGVGLLVGVTVRYLGQGDSVAFGIIGGAISLFSCLLGNLFSQIGFYAINEHLNFFEVLISLNYAKIPEIIIHSFQPLDLLFYVLAIYTGAKLSRNGSENLYIVVDPHHPQELEYPKSKQRALILILITLASCYFIISFNANKTKSYYHSNGQKQSQGRLKWGMPQGKWTYWNKTGQLTAEVNFKKGIKEGLTKLYYPNGQISSAKTYVKGLLHGELKEYDNSSRLIVDTDYQYGRQHGKFEKYFSNGSLEIQGQYYLDRKDSIWTYWYENGSKKATGEFEKGEYTGLWKYWYEDGKPYQEINHTENDSLLENYWDKNGSRLIKDGRGVFTTYFENGNKDTEGKVENSYKTGIWKEWYDNKNLKSITEYTHGEGKLLSFWDKNKKILIEDGTGQIELYYDNGQILLKAEYKDGVLHGEATYYYENGKPMSNSIFKNGKPNGQFISYYENGNKGSQGTFKDGQKTGEWQFWEENGALSSKTVFNNNKKEGTQYFYENGLLMKEEIYVNGELIKTKIK